MIQEIRAFRVRDDVIQYNNGNISLPKQEFNILFSVE